MNVPGSIRKNVRKVMKRIAGGLNSATDGKLSPNFITIFGLLMHLPIALLIASGDFISASVLLVIFGLFDAIDGELARLQNSASKFGMLLDSVTDRMKEIFIYIAIAYYYVSFHDPNLAIWAVAACGASLLVSYVNAWGEVVSGDRNDKQQNKTFRVGIMTFDVRMFVLVVGLVTDKIWLALIIITVLAWVTVFERLNTVRRKLR